MISATALIAEDEPLLARVLVAELGSTWPTLAVVANVPDGRQAVERLLELQPDVAFLDIRMPGATGLEVAQETIEEWPDDAEKPLPLFVFVTAYSEFALDAFELAAVDYLLKPVTAERLASTVGRLQARLGETASDQVVAQPGDRSAGSMQDRSRRPPPQSDRLAILATELQSLLRAESGSRAQSGSVAEPLRTIRAGVGDSVFMIPLTDVLLFEAADKYVVVHTATRQALIRESLRDLLPRLDPLRFAQIHRGSIVNLDSVEAAVRGETGKLTLRLRGSSQEPIVSKLYRHLFQSM